MLSQFGDIHLYKNHIEQAKEQISRESYELPELEITNINILKGEFDFYLVDYESHPPIKAPLSN